MKKFEIIEEGRLSKSEMTNIVGGDYTCVPANQYKVVQGCMGGGTLNYSQCSGYVSCLDDTQLSCKNYVGPQGPGGLSATTNSLLAEEISYNKLLLPSVSSISSISVRTILLA
jgi:hypothetical protein